MQTPGSPHRTANTPRPQPTLGELALQARLIRGNELDEALRYQRQAYAEGDFRRLGEILVSYGRLSRPAVRRLLQRQAITIAECMLCRTRYNAINFRGYGECLRCGRRLLPSKPHAALTVEDTISGGGPKADEILASLRQRNPMLGRYEIRGEVGRGGMGVIYKAYETRLRRMVALKFMRMQEDLDAEDLERFRREARAVANLKHPHIVQAIAIEETPKLTYMAMEFISGVAMDSLTNEGALSEAEIVRVVARVAEGLHYAHEAGIIHRDVKPANIVINRDVEPFLVDFGVAKQVQDKGTLSLTSEGEVLGSLAYMAPEYVQKGRKALDRRCDVYGLGVVLYETLTQGLLPYGDPDEEDMIMRLVKEPPIPIERAMGSVPSGLAKIVNRACAKDPEQRHATAQELAEDLDAYLKTGEGVKRAVTTSGDVFARTSAEFMPPAEAMVGSSGSSSPSAGDDGDSRSPGLWAFVAIAMVIVTGIVAAGWAVDGQRKNAAIEALRLQAGEAELRAGQALKPVDPARAKRAFDRAVDLMPTSSLPLLERAAVHEILNDPQAAAADRAKATELSK